MADFKLRAPPRLRLSALVSIGGVIGQGAAVPLAGSALASAQAAAALLRGVNLGGAASASAQATAALLRGLRLQGAAVAGASASASFNWFLAPITLTIGAGAFPGGQSNVAATLPGNFIPGGLFLIDPAATPLPAGMTFSEAGVLNVGSATISIASGVRSVYYEPTALAALTLHPNATGTLPYLATWYPPETVVPAGQTAVSPDDANLRGSVLSTWPDGSAQVITLAGETAVTSGVTKTIRLRAGAPSGTALTTARINAIVSTIAVNFGGGTQTLTLSGATPDRTWWANESTICARYRLSCNVGALEAVIDIHAFRAGTNDSALVEVVIENGKVNANLATVTAPTTQSYTNATVSVNGTTIATVSNPVAGTFGGVPYYVAQQHEAFRAWYCSAKVVGGVVTALTTAQQQSETFGIEVTQDAVSMQAHPALFKIARNSTANLQTLYQNDVYEPWSFERQRGAGMGSGGDHSSIGSLPLWAAQYLQSGNRYARRAVLANTLAVLSYGVIYRDTTTNLVPTYSQVGNKTRNADTWPETTQEPAWETAHSPAEGLMAFMCRPSPCFIEIAQNIATHNCTWFTGNWVLGYYNQTRGRAWGIRALAHAIFLTPTLTATDAANVAAWRTGAQTALQNNVTDLDGYRTNPVNRLGVICDMSPTAWADQRGTSFPGFQFSVWQHHFLSAEIGKIANTKLLSGAAQTALVTFADWASLQPIRYVNESVAGEWRFHRYMTTIGQQNYNGSNGGQYEGGEIYSGPDPNMAANWGAQHAAYMVGSPPSASGAWAVNGIGCPTSYAVLGSDGPNFLADPVANQSYNYVTHFWQAFCIAVERGVTGADAAWATVTGNHTALPTWLDGFGSDPRQGLYPRNKP